MAGPVAQAPELSEGRAAMVRDAMKGYLGMASGLTELTRQRALDLAKTLVAQGEATAGQTKALAEELLSTGRSNRDAVVQLVRYEVDRAVGRMGLAPRDEVDALTARVRALESRLRELAEDRADDAAAPVVTRPTPKSASTKKAPATKTPTKKKSAAKKATSKRTQP